jgi:hypothetical protein
MVDVKHFLDKIDIYKIDYDTCEYVKYFEPYFNTKINKTTINNNISFAILGKCNHGGIFYEVEEEIDISKSKVYKFPSYVDIITNIICEIPIHLYIPLKDKSIKMNTLSYINFACIDRNSIFTLCCDNTSLNKIKIKYTCCLLSSENRDILIPYTLFLYPFCYSNGFIDKIVI